MWKSIDSAPKDGTPVLLIARAMVGGTGARPSAVVGYWSGQGRSGWVDAILKSGVPGRDEIELVATHWAEIPQFPVEVE
jgi:hypothetical protein